MTTVSTASSPSRPAAHRPVAEALAAIEASKLTAGPDVIECLDAIGDLIRITEAPSVIFEWVVHFLGSESLWQYAAQHHITLHESRATDEEQLPRAVVIWTATGDGMAIVPQGQHPATALLQLREEIAQRDEELKRAADFQASVAAGHVEGVAAWHARTSQAGR